VQRPVRWESLDWRERDDDDLEPSGEDLLVAASHLNEVPLTGESGQVPQEDQSQGARAEVRKPLRRPRTDHEGQVGDLITNFHQNLPSGKIGSVAVAHRPISLILTFIGVLGNIQKFDAEQVEESQMVADPGFAVEPFAESPLGRPSPAEPDLSPWIRRNRGRRPERGQ
jgi:hypothetical protein